MNQEEHHKLIEVLEGKPWDTRKNLLAFMATAKVDGDIPSKQRTLTQNAALHLFFNLLAETLNDAGFDMKKTLKPEVDIPWTGDLVKTHLWKPIQKSLLGKKSTTELTKDEVGKVYETLNRYLGEKLAIHVPFPSDPEKDHPLMDALEMAKTVDYPDEYKEPEF